MSRMRVLPDPSMYSRYLLGSNSRWSLEVVTVTTWRHLPGSRSPLRSPLVHVPVQELLV